MFGIGSTGKNKKSVFEDKHKNVNLDAFGKSVKIPGFGILRKNRKVETEKQSKGKSLYDVLNEKPEMVSEKADFKCNSFYESLNDAEKDRVNAEVAKTVKWSLRFKSVGECLFLALIVGVFVCLTSWFSDGNEAELEARRAEVARSEIVANVKVLKSIEAKNPREPLPDTLELVAATELGQNNIVIIDPWGKPYVYDKKNRLMRCIVKNPDGSVKYEIARRF